MTFNEPSVLEACGLVDATRLCAHWALHADSKPRILLDEIHGFSMFSILPGVVLDELNTLQEILIDRIIGGDA